MITLVEFLEEARSALNVMDPRNFDRTGKKRAKPRTDKQMKADAWVDKPSRTGKPYSAQTEKLLDKGMDPRMAYAIANKRRKNDISQAEQQRMADAERRRGPKKPKSPEEMAKIDRHKVAETEKWTHRRRKKTAAERTAYEKKLDKHKVAEIDKALKG